MTVAIVENNLVSPISLFDLFETMIAENIEGSMLEWYSELLEVGFFNIATEDYEVVVITL